MSRPRFSIGACLVLAAALASSMLSDTSARAEETSPLPQVGQISIDQTRIISRARLEIARGVKYAGTWERTSGYPMGDIRPDRGACTDLVVRSLRAAGIDLQRLVHEDMVAVKSAYGIERPDPQVDHRRVSTMLTFFQRRAKHLSTNARETKAFAPGDVVFFAPKIARQKAQMHVGIVSDKIGRRGLPLILENGGPRPVESDTLDQRPIVGHFRPEFTPADDSRDFR